SQSNQDDQCEMSALPLSIADYALPAAAETRAGDSLRAENLFFRYSKKTDWVINDFSHLFRPGITLIEGASGCGKSTLLRLLAGYLRPSRGKIEAFGSV